MITLPKLRLTKRNILIAGGIIVGALILYLVSAFIWAWTLTPRLVNQYQQTTPENTLTPRQLHIIKQVEDPSFDSNIGVDIGTPGQGATTITQSLARDVYLNQPIGGAAGIPQAIYKTVFKYFKKVDLGRDVMAVALHSRTSQAAIMDMFVGRTYMGDDNGQPVYGLQQASKLYYGQDIGTLGEQDFISLVAMLKSPGEYHALDHTAANAARSAKIKHLLDGSCTPSGHFDTVYKAC